jgi:ribosomal protein S18 acetylase RimI-like enzyme
MTVTVRAAHTGEYDRVGTLTIAAYRTLPVDHLWNGYDVEILDTAERAKAASILVADADGTVVGAVTYVGDSSSPWSEWTEPGEAQFRLLAVDPSARGAGVGEALVRACLREASAADQRVVIHTTPWMAAARRMYERLGFVRRPERDVPYEEWHGEGGFDLPTAWVGQAFLSYTWSG